MPSQVKPEVYIVGQTVLNPEMLAEALSSIGAPEWNTDAPTDGEKLAEFYGRLCYRSFAPGMNPNVTKVREGNSTYLQNIVSSMHGSVLEHISVNFVFKNVSRVFTHELVRHRVGTAMSQESLRYVRLQDIDYWLPDCIASDDFAKEVFAEVIEYLEGKQKLLSDHYKLDEEDAKFSDKKKITSALRRIAPIGLATSIGWTANIRTLRTVLEARTSPHSEEEIRLVFAEVGRQLCEKYPNFFWDFTPEVVDGIAHYKPRFSKI